MEHPELEWAGRFNYLAAKHHVMVTELYVADLIWAIAQPNYKNEFRMPSDVWEGKKPDKRSKTQILDDLMNGLGGE